MDTLEDVVVVVVVDVVINSVVLLLVMVVDVVAEAAKEVEDDGTTTGVATTAAAPDDEETGAIGNGTDTRVGVTRVLEFVELLSTNVACCGCGCCCPLDTLIVWVVITLAAVTCTGFEVTPDDINVGSAPSEETTVRAPVLLTGTNVGSAVTPPPPPPPETTAVSVETGIGVSIVLDCAGRKYKRRPFSALRCIATRLVVVRVGRAPLWI